MSLPLSPHLEQSVCFSRNLTTNQVPITDLNSTRKLVIEVVLNAAQRKPQTHDTQSEEDQPPRIHRAYRAHIPLHQSTLLSALYSNLIYPPFGELSPSHSCYCAGDSALYHLTTCSLSNRSLRGTYCRYKESRTDERDTWLCHEETFDVVDGELKGRDEEQATIYFPA